MQEIGGLSSEPKRDPFCTKSVSSFADPTETRFNFGIAILPPAFDSPRSISFVRFSPYSPARIHRPTLDAASRKPLDELTPQVKNARLLWHSRVMARNEGA